MAPESFTATAEGSLTTSGSSLIYRESSPSGQHSLIIAIRDEIKKEINQFLGSLENPHSIK